MFLMFTLHRPDVLATGDLGVRNAVMRAYGLDAPPNAAGADRDRRAVAPVPHARVPVPLARARERTRLADAATLIRRDEEARCSRRCSAPLWSPAAAAAAGPVTTPSAGARVRRPARQGHVRPRTPRSRTSRRRRARRCSSWPTGSGRRVAESGSRARSSRSATTGSRSGDRQGRPSGLRADRRLRGADAERPGRGPVRRARRRAADPGAATAPSRPRDHRPVRRRLRRRRCRFPKKGKYAVLAVTKDGRQAARRAAQVHVITKSADPIPEVGEKAPKVHTDTLESRKGDVKMIDTRDPAERHAQAGRSPTSSARSRSRCCSRRRSCASRACAAR